MTGFCTNYMTPLSLDILYGLPCIFTFCFLGITYHFYHRILELCQKVPEYTYTYIPPRNIIFILRLRSLSLCFQHSCLIAANINRGYYIHKFLRRPKVTISNAHQANYMTSDMSG